MVGRPGRMPSKPSARIAERMPIRRKGRAPRRTRARAPARLAGRDLTPVIERSPRLGSAEQVPGGNDGGFDVGIHLMAR